MGGGGGGVPVKLVKSQLFILSFNPSLISCSLALKRHLSVICLSLASMTVCEREPTNSNNCLILYTHTTFYVPK